MPSAATVQGISEARRPGLVVRDVIRPDHRQLAGIAALIRRRWREPARADLLIDPSREPDSRLILLEDRDRVLGCLRLEAHRKIGENKKGLCDYRWLVMEDEAPGDGVDALVGYASAFFDASPGFTTARVAATDHLAIRGLGRSGFKVICGEAVLQADRPEARPIPPGNYRIDELQARHIQEALDLPGNCFSSSLVLDPGFGWLRLRSLAQRLLQRAIRDEHRGGLVAEGQDGRLAGFLLHSRPPGPPAGVVLDWVCTGRSRNGLFEILVRSCLAKLQASRIPVMTRCLLEGPQSLDRLAALRKLGFTVSLSNLVMHRPGVVASLPTRPEFLPGLGSPQEEEVRTVA